MNFTENQRYSALFILLGMVFFVPFLGAVHLFDWDEINFAEISREMILLKDYLRVHVDFLPFYEKPPLFFWMQVIAMKIFSIGEFAARFPNAVIGMFTLIILFRMGKHLYDTRFGWFWAMAYFGSLLPHLYFRSGIIDPYFNLFIFLGLYFYITFYWKGAKMKSIKPGKLGWYYLILAGFFIGLAMLTKGPVAYLVSALTIGIYWTTTRFKSYFSIPKFLIFTIISFSVIGIWLLIETSQNGPAFFKAFNAYQLKLAGTAHASHGGFPGYHFVVLLFGCFPASIFAIRGMKKLPGKEKSYKIDFHKWMTILFWVVLILFTIVRSKIVHYSSLCYFPITFFAAYTLHKLYNKKIEFNRWMWGSYIGIASIFLIALLAVPYLGMNIEWLQSKIADPFARENLNAASQWSYSDYFPALVFFFVIGISVIFIRKNDWNKTVIALFSGMGIFIFIALFFFVNKIEGYSQRAAIDFLKEKSQEDCYISTIGYKTYTTYFYGNKQLDYDALHRDRDWLCYGDVDRDVYLLLKAYKRDNYKLYLQNFYEVGNENGFLFMKRDKVTASE